MADKNRKKRQGLKLRVRGDDEELQDEERAEDGSEEDPDATSLATGTEKSDVKPDIATQWHVLERRKQKSRPRTPLEAFDQLSGRRR